MPLAAPTLSLAVDDDGVVTATIGNSNVASTNVLYRSQSVLTPTPVWTQVGTRTGNGTITNSPGDGTYYYYVQTTFSGESNISLLDQITVPAVAYLTDLSGVKTFLGISQSDTSEDALLNSLIAEASDLIEEYCGRKFNLATYTEYYCGNGLPFIVLNQRPVVSITSLYVDELAYWGQAPGAFAVTTLKVEGDYYALNIDQPNGTSRSGLVFCINGWWPIPFNYAPGLISPFLGPGVGNIKVVYSAGYANVPTPLQLACNMLIAKTRNSRTYGEALVSEKDEVYSYQLKSETKMGLLSKDVTSILAKYKNQAVA